MTDREKDIKGKLVELCEDLETLPCCATYEEQAEYLISHGVTVQQWIPVTERLPEEDEQVLCRYVFGEHNDRPFYQVLDYYAFDPHPHFQHEGTNGMCVTHWMPLPELPREE